MPNNLTNRLIIPDTHYLRCQIPHCNKHADLYCASGRQDGLDTDLPPVVQYALCPEHAVEYGYCRNCGKHVGKWALQSIYPRLDGLCNICRELISINQHGTTTPT